MILLADCMMKLYLCLILAAGTGLCLPAFAQPVTETLSGRVLAADGEVLPGAVLVLDRINKNAVSDESGRFTIRGIRPGTYELRVSMMGYKPFTKSVLIRTGRTNEVNITLDPEQVSLREVVIAGKSQVQQAREQAFNVAAIDVKKLYNSSSDLNQILNRSTGIRVREDGGLGSNFTFSLNGFSGRQVKFFLDGIPMDNFGSSLTLNNIPANLVERVEIYKGVVPVTLGSDALGGAVNIITNQSSRSYLDASYTYGSFNTHRAALTGRYHDVEKGFLVNGNLFHNYSDNSYKVDVEIPDPNTGKVNGLTRVKRFHDAYRSSTLMVEAGVTGRKYADKLLIGLTVSGNRKEVQTASIMNIVVGQAHSTDRTLMPSLKYVKENLFTKGMSLSAQASYNEGRVTTIDTSSRKYDWSGHYVVRTDPNLGEISGGKSHFTYSDKTAMAVANLGYEAGENSSFSFNYTQINFRRQGDDLYDKNATFKQPNILDKKVMGASYKINLLDSRWSTSVFAKYFILNTYTYNWDASVKISAQNAKPGYGIATTYHVAPSAQVKASFENTYRMPESVEIVGDGISILRNTGLLPEESANVNLGILFNHTYGKHLVMAEAGGTYRNIHNLIRQQLTGLVTQYINQQSAASTGFETDLKYHYNNLVNVGVNLTYQNLINTTKYENGSSVVSDVYKDRIPNTPYLYGNFDAGIHFKKAGFKDGHLTVNFWTSFVERYFLYWPSLGSSGTKLDIPRQVVHNAGITYAFLGDRYNISLECRNLADTKAYDNFRLQKPGRALYLKLRYFIKS